MTASCPPDADQTPQGEEPFIEEIVHGSAVAYCGRAVLILGASGRGKSALCLDLISKGASLVADDRTHVYATPEAVLVDAPATIKGKIEARGVGILRGLAAGPRPLALVVDLDQDEVARLPSIYTSSRFGICLPLLYRVTSSHFSAAILQFLSHGRSA